MPYGVDPVLVIGRQGQLARALHAAGRPDVVCIGRPEGDLADPAGLARLIGRVRPRLVLNAGGFTRVDPAETAADEAFSLNRDGPAMLARLCEEAGIVLIHISTDCVFDGRKPHPYTPADPPSPLSVYGRSKLAGEEAVAGLCRAHLIVRVSWVFSEYADNFVPLMLRLARQAPEVTVVDDQVGFPTYCPDLAAALLMMADRVLEPGFRDWGIFHLAGRQAISRADMAEAAFAISRACGGPGADVRRIATRDYPTPARRPLNARLDSARAEKVFGVRIPDWKEGLAACIPRLLAGPDGCAGGHQTREDRPDV